MKVSMHPVEKQVVKHWCGGGGRTGNGQFQPPDLTMSLRKERDVTKTQRERRTILGQKENRRRETKNGHGGSSLVV